MKAWRVHELGEPAAVLRLETVATPTPGPGQVLIDVAAAGLNFADILLCQGKYQEKPSLPFTPGLEAAGTVAAVGEGVTGFALGQRVIATPAFGQGAFAEQTLAPEAGVFAIPDSLDFASAAALQVIYQTGYVALHRRAALRPGETLLVHAGAGGVGSAAIQLGLAAGARVFATAGGPEKTEICRQLGAELAIDYTREDFVAAVMEATNGAGADVIYDSVGGDTFDRSIRCIAFEGRVLVIGFAGGRVAHAPTNWILVNNYSVVGFNHGLYRRRLPGHEHEIHAELMRLHERGLIKPLIFREFALEEVPAALTLLGDRGTWGKVVCRVAGGK